MTTDFRALCADLLRELDHASAWDYRQALKDQARAALAEPEPEVEPTLREEFTMILNEARCNSPGRVIGNIELGRRLVAAVERFKRARPEPEGPTDEEILELSQWHEVSYTLSDGDVIYPMQEGTDMRDAVLSFTKAVLTRWGNHPQSPDSSVQPQ